MATDVRRAESLELLSRNELEALLDSAAWYAKYHAHIINEQADDRSSAAGGPGRGVPGVTRTDGVGPRPPQRSGRSPGRKRPGEPGRDAPPALNGGSRLSSPGRPAPIRGEDHGPRR